MAQYHSVQVRMAEEDFTEGKKLFFEGKEYTIGDTVPQTLQPKKIPMGAFINGYTKQVALLLDGQVVGQAWFYCYGSVEGGRWAVLDEVETFL